MTFPTLLAALPLLLRLLPAAVAAPPPPSPFPALGREIVERVHASFYDPRKAERWAAENARYADGITDRAAFHRATRERLARLGASHTQYYTADDVGYQELLAVFAANLKRPAAYEGIGAEWAEHQGGWFVVQVFPNSPAEKAGLHRGDRVATADGAPFAPRPAFRGQAGREVRLGLERRHGAPLLDLTVVPREIEPREEWLAAQKDATRMIERGGHRIAYALVWVCAGDEPQRLLADALQGPLADAEALVLDLRGGLGGCSPSFLDLFNPTTPELTRIDRQGQRVTFAASWHKPLVVLIDGGSRSGKEMVVRAIQRHHLGTLVGERTAGAVVAGQPFVLSDGALLYLAVEDIRVDGERLEGKGVEPEVAVAGELEFADGRDPQLERALAVAVEKVKAAG